MAAMTLEQLLSKTSDGTLLDIQNELLAGVVPSTGYARGFCRKVNRMIDQGRLCINTTGYRKLYLPSLAKCVNKELARRYVIGLTNGTIAADGGSEEWEI